MAHVCVQRRWKAAFTPVPGESILGAMNDPILHSAASAHLVVGPGDPASALPLDAQDAFPGVLGTARPVALMEIASARLLRPHLGPGELSVGDSLKVTHSAPTPPGARVTATARYLGREGKLFVFEVVASDAGGEVGRARHQRAIVQGDLDDLGVRLVNPRHPAVIRPDVSCC